MAASLLSLRLPTNARPSLVTRASSSSTLQPQTSSVPPTTTSTTTQELEQSLGRKGIKFADDSTGAPSVVLSVRNGSSLQLRLNDGLITSYKPKVLWDDDGCREVLYTIPGESPAALKGGIGLVLNEVSRLGGNGLPWQASQWEVLDADSDSFDAMQVELGCTNSSSTLDISYVVSLYPLSMAAAVVVANNGPKPVELTGAILNHIKMHTRIGAAVDGLKGCSYCAHPPLASPFSLLSPAEAMVQDPPPGFFALPWSRDNEAEPKRGAWAVEDDLVTIVRKKMSRVYTAPPEERKKPVFRTPPSKYSTIDQGSGLGYRLIKMGFDDIYLSSPGSWSKKFGNDYFICTGPASMLEPVILNPGEEWEAAQVMEHDNL